jgi:hypothetical protein
MFTWKRLWLFLGAVVGIWIGLAGFIEGTREPIIAGMFCLAGGLVCAWWLVASFTDKPVQLVADEDGVVHVPLRRTAWLASNTSMVVLAFVLGTGNLFTPEGSLSWIVGGLFGLVSIAFLAFAFMGLFAAAKGPAMVELMPGEMRMRMGVLPWRVAWTDIADIKREPFAGTPSLSILFKQEAFTRDHPNGWFSPPVQPNPCWFPAQETSAEKDELFDLVIDYWQRGQLGAAS